MKEVHVAFASFVCAPCPFADFPYVIGYVATVCLACTSMYLQHCAFAVLLVSGAPLAWPAAFGQTGGWLCGTCL